MKSMRHKDVRTAMRYQHPELGIVRDALNATQTMRISDVYGTFHGDYDLCHNQKLGKFLILWRALRDSNSRPSDS